MLLPTTELKVVKNCVILPHDYVYCKDGKNSDSFIKNYLLFNEKPLLFSTYVRQTLVDKITRQLNYLVTKGKKVNKIKAKCTRYRYGDGENSVLYFALDFSELENKIDDKIFVDIRGLQIVTINDENDVNCKHLMGTIHMASTNINRYDLHSTENMNVILSADHCLHDSTDDEDLARIIAFIIYSSLDNIKKKMGDKKNLMES